MKNLKKLVCVGLIGLMFIGSGCKNVTEGEIITKGDKTFIGYDTIERDENLEVIKYFKIKNAKVKFYYKKNTYTVEFKTKKNCKEARKLVKNIANKLHGNEIEKLFKEYRTYNVKVIAKIGNNHSYSYYIKGHKVVK